MEFEVGAISGAPDHAFAAKLVCERGPRLKPIFLARRFSAGLKSGFPVLKTGGSLPSWLVLSGRVLATFAGGSEEIDNFIKQRTLDDCREEHQSQHRLGFVPFGLFPFIHEPQGREDRRM
jgi:hypothetical protein